MSDALILEKLFQRQFDGKHQIQYKHSLSHPSTRESSTSTNQDSTSSPASKPYGTTTTITANRTHAPK